MHEWLSRRRKDINGEILKEDSKCFKKTMYHDS